jgi:hypothetical protein
LGQLIDFKKGKRDRDELVQEEEERGIVQLLALGRGELSPTGGLILFLRGTVTMYVGQRAVGYGNGHF